MFINVVLQFCKCQYGKFNFNTQLMIFLWKFLEFWQTPLTVKKEKILLTKECSVLTCKKQLPETVGTDHS